MLNTLLALFTSAPCLVAPEMQIQFEACVKGMAAHEKTAELMNAPMMAAGDNFWPDQNDWRSQLRPYNVKDGVLYIPVRGVLMHDFPWQFYSYATGYAYIEKAIQRGQEDSNVKGIALVIHSPGGMVSGCFDLVERIEKIENRKPIRAFAHEYAASAAYAIAAVADHIAISRTGMVGSIGVVTSHTDISEAMDKAGVKITFVHAGKYKVAGNPYEKLDADTKARMQARVDSHYEIFVSSVARNRGMDEKAVRETEALIFTAKEAVANGLADSIGPLDDAVAAFASELSANDTGDEQMKTFTQEQLDAAVASARTEGHAAGKADGVKEGATGERARINAILESDEAKDRPAAAMAAALSTDMSVEATASFLAKLPKETPAATVQGSKQDDKATTQGDNGNRQKFDSAMEQSDNPNLGASDGSRRQDADEDSADSVLALAGGAALPGLRRKSA